jgi:hypothetical protein
LTGAGTRARAFEKGKKERKKEMGVEKKSVICGVQVL